MTRALAALAAAVGLAGALAGCGLGAGAKSGSATLTVSVDFGRHRVGAVRLDGVRESDTVMRVLQRHFRVSTRYGGGFVQSIDGLAGGRRGARPVDWFFYVNGIEAGKGAAATSVHAGDRILWDRHDWSAAMDTPAIVASFPEPLRHGVGGRRIPVRLECDAASGAACEEASRRLQAAGVLAARAGLGAESGEQIIRVLVGPWASLRGDVAAQQLERGPRASGVYVRPEDGGRRLAVLDERGRVAERLGAGAGLVAATRFAKQAPTWLVTGTDRAGALAAARALTQRDLDGRFAVVVARGGVLRAPEVQG